MRPKIIYCILKPKLSVIILFLLTINLISVSFDYSNNSLGEEFQDEFLDNNEKLSESMLYSSNSFHDPIFINGSDWKSWCDAVTGNGTVENPYIIANLSIVASESDGISIHNSNANGKIYNCTIMTAKMGVVINNTSNCYISQNNISNCMEDGIFCYNSSFNCFIENNVVQNCGFGGITIVLASCVSLEGNKIQNNPSHGISLTYVSNSIVRNNNISRISGFGFIFSNLSNCSIENNGVVENNGDGLLIFDSIYVNIFQNIVSNNIGEGIGVYTSEFCVLSNNTAKYNYFSGIKLGFFVNHSQIYNNTLHKNRIEGIPVRGFNNTLFSNLFISFIIPSFVMSKTIVVINEKVSFIDTSRFGYLPFQYLWDFGDNFFSSEQHPYHTYTKIGDYNVSLTVVDSDGDEASFQMEILVINDDISSNSDPISSPLGSTMVGYIVGVSLLVLSFILVMLWRRKM
ncbi:hypothetical protein NEF87_004697 [Candidatus Lokiarchaeum ossiferum]|uniref:PKD domain-containing protein n=1 Tax=Candidatus Lokiarchaeum ossiferum TaxID=2951803 RepID=A0ABY6I1G2_9ARCH|nr:hypothetical protein NEF87_004697 [Candidatus Lokiarchaeum sp. B-35]